MSWIAATTRPKAEHVARMNLMAQGYETVLPLVSVDGEITLAFPGYIFADTSPRSGQWRPINNTRGVKAVIMTGERPSIVPARDIDKMRAAMANDGAIHISRTKPEPIDLEHGQTIKLLDGPFQGFEAIFQHDDAQARIFALIEFMGAPRVVELEDVRVMAVA